MNKKALIGGGVVLLLIVLGIAGYFLTSRSKTSPVTSENQTSDSMQETGSISKRSSLRELLGLGKNLTCTYTDDQGKGQGVMYMSGENIRTDFEMTLPEQGVVTSHMISDGEYVYIWSDGQTTGYKQLITDTDEVSEKGSTEVGESQSMDLDQQVDIDCDDWRVDASKFELPEGVTFSDFESMMKDAMEDAGMENIEKAGDAMETNDTDPCSACEMLQGDTKTQCLQALGC